MAQTNMDIKKNPNATVPVMEFMIPISEFDMEVKAGERGKIILPIEVVAVNDGMITFRKMDSITAHGTFHKETVNEMRERLMKDEPIEEDGEEESEDSED
jgi:hypothetical protein